VVVLKVKPSKRFQLLGPVDVKAPRKKQVRAALATRALLMGADAVVGVHEERLPGAFRTEYRASGTAIRAVDREGRLELKARWFDAQVRSIRVGVILLALFGSSRGFGTNKAVPFADEILSLSGLVALGLMVAFAWLSWPQLARPVAICSFGAVAAIVALVLGSVSGVIAAGDLLAGSLQLAILAVIVLFNLTILAFSLYIGRRALAIDRDYRQLVVGEEEQVTGPRRVVGRLALWFSAVYAILLVASAAWSSFHGARDFPEVLKKSQKFFEEAKKKAAADLAKQRDDQTSKFKAKQAGKAKQAEKANAPVQAEKVAPPPPPTPPPAKPPADPPIPK
jgi:hypothetical protein